MPRIRRVFLRTSIDSVAISLRILVDTRPVYADGMWFGRSAADAPVGALWGVALTFAPRMAALPGFVRNPTTNLTLTLIPGVIRA